MKIQRLLVPVDGSALARKAADVAASLASRFQAEVTLFIAMEPPEMAREYADPGAIEGVRQALWQAAEMILDQAEADIRPQTQRVAKKVVWGMPAAAIAAEADTGYDLVVMGSRGMGLLPADRDLLGSVAEGVLRRTHSPVLIIPRHAEDDSSV